MVFSLDRVVPWGRSFEEYRRMFRLSPAEMAGRILGCGDGPASFNAEAYLRGIQIVSLDPLYCFGRSEISQRIDETYPQIMDQTRLHVDAFVWRQFRSPEELGTARMGAMRGFLADYDLGRQQGRYLPAALPYLPFPSQAFDLALCSHFLFLYELQFDLDFHLHSIREMSRVAKQTRIFPLLGLGGEPSRHLAPLLETLQSEGYLAEVETVDYELQRGGNQMLTVERPLARVTRLDE